MRLRGSLARQLFGLQLLIVLALLGAVAAVTIAQSHATFRDTEGGRLLSVAEDVAATAGVRVGAEDEVRRHWLLPPFAESARAQSGADFVIITDARGTVLTSPDPAQVGEKLPAEGSTALGGRSWVGVVGGAVVAHVPVISDAGRVLGLVAVGSAQPSTWETITSSPGDLLVYLGIAAVIGLGGSLVVSWWIKRQTLGLEPREITGLVEHREAMLRGVKEGVLGLDEQNRITLVNDQALRLLNLSADCVGQPVDSLELNERLRDVLAGRASGQDEIALRKGRVLTMNRMPVSVHEQPIGAVITMRDRTELAALRHELDVHRQTTDTLRAQAHEFTNQLHTISGLIELGEYDEVVRYVTRASRTHEAWSTEVVAKVADPALAALLIAKASLAAEHAVGLRLSADSRIGELDEALSADLVTVVGNLVDNALDALPATGGGWVEVDLRQTDTDVLVRVRDSGPGVAPEIAEEVFRHGFTTKVAEHGGQRGIGLALTRQICVRRGGEVSVRNDGGAVFSARLGLSAAGGSR
ncbi:ATP-binding protein [Allokutzneria sp. A3M-2-11 16]|uniref:sensor histidine kinase n=1 Tax=Allokutzneria sp. A3M-2-11 16 TaxID=2962043 RepID=UPI0020B757FD|nr:ATP-binding protein [Allokutzneria sp. A3M-2-11 16]MCP3799191.1 ATP-binding protein [Allokutzneria sp. A3M-2-11 16]